MFRHILYYRIYEQINARCRVSIYYIEQGAGRGEREILRKDRWSQGQLEYRSRIEN